MDTKSSAYASYRRFLEYFAENVDPTDQLPVRVPNYPLNESEITGAVTDWIIQYLNDKWVIRLLFSNSNVGAFGWPWQHRETHSRHETRDTRHRCPSVSLCLLLIFICVSVNIYSGFCLCLSWVFGSRADVIRRLHTTADEDLFSKWFNWC